MFYDSASAVYSLKVFKPEYSSLSIREFNNGQKITTFAPNSYQSVMNRTIKLRKGLEIPLKGAAADIVTDARTLVSEVGVCPPDFIGFTPRLVVAEGDSVEVGTPLFADKHNEALKITAPVSGKVTAVVRGERRRLLCVKIESDGQLRSADFGGPLAAGCSAADVVALMNASGLAAYVRQRPYDTVPDTSVAPRDIFVSMFSKMPLAADVNIVLRGREDFFRAGIKVLSKIAPVYIGIAKGQEEMFAATDGAETVVFDGPNPSGNVGVQINNIKPINKGETVWTLAPESVAILGKLATTGCLDFTHRIALAGSEIVSPQYYDTVYGAQISPLLQNQLKHEEHIRIINGNPLVGKKTTKDGFLAPRAGELTVIPEGDNTDEMLGWISPRLGQFSTSHSYLSWLMPRRRYNIDARIKGGERHMIMSGEYDRVLPMDIYWEYLVKAIIARDIDKMEQLGIYEVAPEDFAVAEFVDSSKLELQKIVREGLDFLRKELS